MIEAQRRVERAVSAMIDDMYKTHLRKMQSDMHICAAKCCNDPRHGKLENVQHCIEGCADPLVKAQDFLQHELGQFQGRLQTCVMECNQSMRNSVPTTLNESELAKYRYQFERCANDCVDKHIGYIPNMMKTIKAVLAKGPEAMRQA